MIEYIWLTDENVPGVLMHHGAFVSWVRYTKGGITYEVLVENDEFEYYDNGDDEDYDE